MFQQVFALLETSLDKRHKFKAGTSIKNMMLKGPAKKTTFLEDLSVFKKRVVTVDPSSLSPRLKTHKHITFYVDYPEFLPYLERTCFEKMPKRCLVATPNPAAARPQEAQKWGYIHLFFLPGSACVRMTNCNTL